MIRSDDIFETIRMFQDEKLDVRTVTLGLNLDDCSSPVLAQLLDKIQAKIVGTAGGLVRATREVERTFGIPVTNKRIAVSPPVTVPRRWSRSPSASTSRQPRLMSICSADSAPPSKRA